MTDACGQELPPVVPCDCPGCWLWRQFVTEWVFNIDCDIMVDYALREAGITGGETEADDD